MENWVDEIPNVSGWYFYKPKMTIKREVKYIPIYILVEKKGKRFFIGDEQEVKSPGKGFWKQI